MQLRNFLGYLIKRVRRKLLIFLWYLNCFVSPHKISRFHLDDGSKFDYPLKSGIGFGEFIGEFEKSEIAFMRKSLKPGDIFIDVGANGGTFTIIAARQVQNHGHVYAFEPDRRNLKLLRHNLKINNITNVTILECALSNKKGIAQLAIAIDGAMNSLAKTHRTDQQITEWQTVKVTTLDDFINEYKIDRVDFVKIDIEGGEKLIFEGAKDIFTSFNQLIIMFEAVDLNTKGFAYSVKDFLIDLIALELNLYYFDDSVLTPVNSSDRKFGNSIYNFVASKQILTADKT
jgi:FkbM family methyltransferase